MSGVELLIPILVPLGAFAMVFGIVYLRTRENLAILEKGKDPRAPRPYNSLKSGLVLCGGGIGLLLAYMLDIYTRHSGDIEPVYFGFIALGGGLGLILSYIIEKKAMDKNPESFR